MHVLADWLLTPQRVAIHGPTATGVVADLHLGYDLSRRLAGEAVPVFRLEDELRALQTAIARHAVRRLVIAGDLFEDGRQSRDLSGRLLQWFDESGVEPIVVPGNHDRTLEEMIGKGKVFPDGFKLGSWRVVHGDGRLPRGQVVHGHIHPCLRWGRIAAPCYLVGKSRLVLPAYSADAAGINVRGTSMGRSFRCYAIVGEQVLDFGEWNRRLRLRAER